jgi:MFS family permease
LYGIATLVLLATSKAEKSNKEMDYTDSIRNKESRSITPYAFIILFSLVMFLITAGSATISNYFNIYLDTELAVPVVIIGTLSALNQLLSVLMALIAPPLMSRWGKEHILVFTFFLRSISLLPIALIPHWLGAGAGYIAAISLMSLSLPAIAVYQQEGVRPEWRTAISGATNTAMGISGAILAYVGTFVITTWGYREMFLLAAVLVGMGAVIFWMYANLVESRKWRQKTSHKV